MVLSGNQHISFGAGSLECMGREIKGAIMVVGGFESRVYLIAECRLLLWIDGVSL